MTKPRARAQRVLLVFFEAIFLGPHGRDPALRVTSGALGGLGFTHESDLDRSGVRRMTGQLERRAETRDPGA